MLTRLSGAATASKSPVTPATRDPPAATRIPDTDPSTDTSPSTDTVTVTSTDTEPGSRALRPKRSR